MAAMSPVPHTALTGCTDTVNICHPAEGCAPGRCSGGKQRCLKLTVTLEAASVSQLLKPSDS